MNTNNWKSHLKLAITKLLHCPDSQKSNWSIVSAAIFSSLVTNLTQFFSARLNVCTSWLIHFYTFKSKWKNNIPHWQTGPPGELSTCKIDDPTGLEEVRLCAQDYAEGVIFNRNPSNKFTSLPTIFFFVFSFVNHQGSRYGNLLVQLPY